MNISHFAFKPILFFVSIGSFLLSWLFTCNLLAAMATTGFATAIAFGLATILEPAKIVFFALGTIKKDFVALIIAVVLTVMSIVGTIGWLQVQHAQKMESATYSSVGFQSLQSQIAGIESQIMNVQETANSLPSNYHTRRQQLMEEANALLAQKNQLTQQLTTYSPSTGLASNALYVSLGRFFRQDSGLIELWINSVYGILLELVAIISGVYVFKSSDNDFSNSVNERAAQKIQKNRDSIIEIECDNNQLPLEISESFARKNGGQKPANSIDRHYSYDISRDELLDYINALFSKVGKGGKLLGRESCREKIGIGQSTANKCHDFLVGQGLIESRNNFRYALATKSEMLNKIESLQ